MVTKRYSVGLEFTLGYLGQRPWTRRVLRFLGWPVVQPQLQLLLMWGNHDDRVQRDH
jgi:hypothetical protein